MAITVLHKFGFGSCEKCRADTQNIFVVRVGHVLTKSVLFVFNIRRINLYILCKELDTKVVGEILHAYICASVSSIRYCNL